MPAAAGSSRLARRRSRRKEQGTVDKGPRESTVKCASPAHGEDGRGEQMPGAPAGTTRAPALASSPRVVGHQDYVIKTLLHGLTGPVSGARPTPRSWCQWARVPTTGLPPSRRTCATRLAIARRLYSAAEVARVARARPPVARTSRGRRLNSESSLPKLVLGGRVEADGESQSRDCLAGARHQSVDVGPRASKPGMWFQVELPQTRDADRDAVQRDGVAGRYRTRLCPAPRPEPAFPVVAVHPARPRRLRPLWGSRVSIKSRCRWMGRRGDNRLRVGREAAR
jgi:hypothetical protein